MEEDKKYELEEFIEVMKPRKARHTELITVLVPAGFDINLITKQLESEKSTSANIKSTTTRKNVKEALESLIRVAKQMKQTPKNGVAMFAGNVFKDGKEEFIQEIYEPPEPLNIRLYRCDQNFVIDPLEEMLEIKEVYGLVVLDRREATIGLLIGKKIKTLQKFDSMVPGKTTKGGQCLSPDTLIMKDNGEIIELKDSHNPLFVIAENFNKEKSEVTPVISKWENNKQLFKITTKYPRLEIKSSKDHLFFVRTENGIEEKPLSEISEGDFLIMPEKINICGISQEIKIKDYYNSFKINEEGRKLLEKKRIDKEFFQKELAEKIGITQTAISTYELGKRNISRELLKKLCNFLNLNFQEFIINYTDFPKSFVLPKSLNEKFAQFLGYFVGDGSIEENRVTFFEQRKELALYYKNLIDNLFHTDCKYKFRESKNYHQIRVYSLELINLIKKEFPELAYAVDSKIPIKILKSPDYVLAKFIKGFFDAEGYVSSNRVGLGINNKSLSKQLQLCLLRFGIISSVLEYDNNKNPYSDKIRYTLTIDDTKCLKRFEELIGFSAFDKKGKLNNLINNRQNRSNVRQLIINGKEIAKIIRNSGLDTTQFKCPSFFVNERQMSKEIFKKKILDKITNNDLRKRLEFIYNSNLILVKISKIKPLKIEKTIDIETKNHNFIANGLIVHNSAARYGRIRENMAKEFFRKIAEQVKKEFYGLGDDLQGILVGGPGPAKEDWLKEGQLITALHDKILGVKDLGYADEHGLELLVEGSQDILAGQEITREKKILEKFFDMLGKQKDKTAYGDKEVAHALGYGAVEKLLLSKKLKKSDIKKYEKKAKETSVDVDLISVETEEGVQFWNLGGIGAILRFKVK
tara:strand:- start:1636 stop:4227 length:2592 start_codon:yes stop_codon:yes gene_type:complete